MRADRRLKLRRQIIEQVRRHRGFSVFWATATQDRAEVLDSMVKRGEVITDNSACYPSILAKLRRGVR